MANPTKYLPSYSYSGFQGANPTKPLPAPRVDDDFANISRSVNETIAALADVRRSDGRLPNGIVGPDALSPTLKIGFTFRGLWTQGESYLAGDGVVHEGVFYSAAVPNIATEQNAPGDASYWTELFSVDDLVVSGALSMPVNHFTGDGTQVEFELDFTPVTAKNLLITIGGAPQETTQYVTVGNKLTFNEAPPEGYSIEVRGFATLAVSDTIVSDTIIEGATNLFMSPASRAKLNALPMTISVETKNAVRDVIYALTKTVYLALAGAEGQFTYRIGNYEARVAADPLRGVYIPSFDDPFGTNGCWVRDSGWMLPDIRWFGCKTVDDDPIFDCTPILNTLAAHPELSTFYSVPISKHGFRTTAEISSGAVKFVGLGCNPMGEVNDITKNNARGEGSWFYLDHSGRGFYFNGDGRSSLGLPGCGTYRNQPVPTTGVPFVPFDHQWDVEFLNCEADISGMVLWNPTRGIKVRGLYAGRIRCDSRVHMHPLKRGLDIAEVLDVCTLNVHQWPYFSLHQTVKDYTLANLITLTTGRIDGVNPEYFFTIFANIAWLISTSAAGILNRARGDWVYCDNCTNSIVFETGSDGCTIQIDHLILYGVATSASGGIGMASSNNNLRIGFLDAENLYDNIGYIDGLNNNVQIDQASLRNWGYRNSGVAAFAVISSTSKVRISGEPEIANLGGRPLLGGLGKLILPGIVKSGLASLSSGATSVVVTHGLPVAPTNAMIDIKRATGTGGSTEPYVNNVTSTTFTINVDTAPSVSGVAFYWRACIDH